MEGLGLSERRACLLTGVSPSVYRYEAKRGNDDELRTRMRELAGERKRFGSPRLHIMLKREGLVVNHKRTERIYREEGLGLRRKRRRKGTAGARVIIPAPERPNQKWSMDFVSDSTVTGRRFRALTIVDDYSRECPARGGTLLYWARQSSRRPGAVGLKSLLWTTDLSSLAPWTNGHTAGAQAKLHTSRWRTPSPRASTDCECLNINSVQGRSVLDRTTMRSEQVERQLAG